jgi:hypothetical protein
VFGFQYTKTMTTLLLSSLFSSCLVPSVFIFTGAYLSTFLLFTAVIINIGDILVEFQSLFVNFLRWF